MPCRLTSALPSLRTWLCAALAWLALAAGAQPAPALPASLLGVTRTVTEPPAAEPLQEARARALLERVPAGAGVLDATQRHEPGQVLWLRFELPATAEEHELYLRLPGLRIQQVVMYFQDGAGRLQVLRAGDLVPASQWALPARNVTFPLGHTGARPRAFVLRLENHLPYGIGRAELVDARELARAAALDTLLMGAFFGVIAFAFAFSLVQFAVRRDRLFGWYALYLALAFVQQDLRFGVSRSLWVIDAPLLLLHARYLTLALVLGSGLVVVRALLPPQLVGPRIHWLCTATIAAALPVAASALLLPLAWSWYFIHAYGLTVLALLAAMLWRAWHPRQWQLHAFALTGAATLVPLLAGIGLLPRTSSTATMSLLAGMAEALILCLALNIGTSDREVLRLVRGDKRERDPVTGLPGPELLPQIVHTLMLRHRRSGQASAVIALDIGNAHDLALHHGNGVIEPMLKAARRVIGEQLRGADLTLRLGRTRFAVVVTRAANHPEVLAVAQRILDSGLRHARELPGSEHLRFHAAVAFLPEAVSGRTAGVVAALNSQLDQIRPGSGLVLRELGRA